MDGCNNPGFFKKADLHDYLKKNPGSIKVYISPYPDLIPAVSSTGEKYVRSEPMIHQGTIYLDCQEFKGG